MSQATNVMEKRPVELPPRRAVLDWPAYLVGSLLIILVRAYQWTLGPVLTLIGGPCCRFQPTCSEYFILAVREYGPLWGVLKGIARIGRCHPWHPGGYDPP